MERPSIHIIELGIGVDSLPASVKAFINDRIAPIEYLLVRCATPITTAPIFIGFDRNARNELCWSIVGTRDPLVEEEPIYPRFTPTIKPEPVRIRISLREEREEECKHYWGFYINQHPEKRKKEKISQPRIQKKFIPLQQPRQSQGGYQKRNQLYFQQQKKGKK